MKILLFLAAIATMAHADTIVTTTVFPTSPTGSITAGEVSSIAEFQFLNDNSATVRLNSLSFLLTETGSVAPWTTEANVDADISNVQLFDDNGLQLGPTLVPTTCGGAVFSSTSFACSFGPLAFVFPRDSVRVLTIRLGLQPGTDLTALQASLLPSVPFNAQQLDDGEDLLHVPLVRVDANLLQVNPVAAEAAAPEAVSLVLCGIGLGLIGFTRIRSRRHTN